MDNHEVYRNDVISYSNDKAKTFSYFANVDGTVYFGFILSALLLIGLVAYIAFIIRVTVKDKRKRRMTKIAVAFDSKSESIGVWNEGYEDNNSEIIHM